jgi:hypothetical protein
MLNAIRAALARYLARYRQRRVNAAMLAAIKRPARGRWMGR